MSENITQETLKGAKWTAIEKVSLQAIQFIIGIILAKLLSPSDFGLVGMLTFFIALSQTFIDGGFGNALIRKIDCTETDYSTAFYFNIGIGIICYVFLFAVSPWIAIFFNKPILSDLLKVIAISILINSLTIVQIAKLTSNINFKVQARSTVIAVVISGIIGITMAYYDFGVWSLAWQTVISASLKCIFLWYQAKWKPSFVFSIASFRDLFSFGSKILTANIIGTLYSNMSTIAIGKFYTPQDLGFYSRGQQFAQLPSASIMDTIGRVTFPILAKIQNDDDRLISVYRKYIRITSLPIFFILTLLAAIAKPLILVLLTEKWEEAAIFLQIFCFACLTEHLSKLNLSLLQIKGRSDLYLRLEIIKKTIAFIILFCSIPFGVVVICLSHVLYGQIALMLNTYYTGKLFSLGYLKQLADFSKYWAISILVCLPVYALTFTSIAPIWQIILGISLATILYLIALRKDTSLNDIKEIIKQRNNKNH